MIRGGPQKKPFPWPAEQGALLPGGRCTNMVYCACVLVTPVYATAVVRMYYPLYTIVLYWINR